MVLKILTRVKPRQLTELTDPRPRIRPFMHTNALEFLDVVDDKCAEGVNVGSLADRDDVVIARDRIGVTNAGNFANLRREL